MRILPGMPLLPLLAAFVAGVIVAHYSPGYLIYGAALLAALCFVHGWVDGARLPLPGFSLLLVVLQ